MLPEILAFVDMTEMNLNRRNAARCNGIPNSNTGMCVRGRINQDPLKNRARIPDCINNVSFVITLSNLNLNL